MLYRVLVNIEMVVSAPTAEEAEEDAIRFVRTEPDASIGAVSLATPLQDPLPNGWDVECIPWGGTKSIREMRNAV